VSDLISCPKKVYFQCKKYTIDLQNTFKFSYLHLIKKVGNLVHKIVQELYKFDEIEKTIISKKYNVKGRIDAIKGNTLYELKTMDNEKFENKKDQNGNEIPVSYEQNHYHQGLIYAYILNNDYNYKIRNISIVYFGRNLKTVFPFNNLPLNDSIAESFLNKSFIISDSLKKNILPREENTSDCTFCPYKKYCKENIENIKPKSKFIL
jgi:CRISPR/Cas system-associated exonuclease Cas4 (RecB family)